MLFQDRTNELIRKSLIEANQAKTQEENGAVDLAIQFFDRRLDHEAIRAMLKQRFAVGIERVGGENDDEVTLGSTGAQLGVETYTKSGVAAAVDQGFFEVVTSGVANKIIAALANLFNQKTQSWKYLSGDSAAEEAAELIRDHRLAGGAETALVNTDSLSCGINTGFMLLDWIGGHLKYRVVSPTAVNAIYHETITDNGVERGVDYSEIDDATVIVIKLADKIESNPGEDQYLAIFGRSDVYPFGRYVQYRANRWDSIPDPGRGGVDYTLDSGDLANPLSWLAAQNVELAIPEYPLLRIDGGLSRITDKFNETTLSLYENMLEIDLAYSRLLKDSLSAARGTHAVSNPAGAVLPRTVEGVISLGREQTLEIVGRPAINAKFALDVLEGLIVAVGNGYSVPDYMLVSDSQALTASSGVALMIRTQPLVEFRDYRIKINNQAVDRLWHIEKGLIEAYTGDQSLRDVDQVWNPGDIEIPEDLGEKIERLTKAQTAKYISYLQAIQDYHGLATIEEAEAMVEQIGEQDTEFPPPQQQQQQVRGAPPVGLTRSQNNFSS